MSDEQPTSRGILLPTTKILKLVKVDPSTLARWRRKNQFPAPAVRISNRCYWYSADVFAWLQAHAGAPAAPPPVPNHRRAEAERSAAVVP